MTADPLRLVARRRISLWLALPPLTLVLAPPLAPAGEPEKGSYVAIVEGKEVPAPQIEMGDEATLQRIIDQGKNHNQVMNHIRYLCEEIGPRLTGSTRLLKAQEWIKDQYVSWGLTN